MVYRLKVELVGGWYWGDETVERVMDVAGSFTLEDLCWDILKSVDFDFEHMYAFRFHKEEYIGGPPFADRDARCDVELKSLGLKKRNVLHLIYDFGDYWEFKITVQNIMDIPEGSTVIVASRGSVEQYPSYDDDWDGTDDDWDGTDDDWDGAEDDWDEDDWDGAEGEWDEDEDDWDEDDWDEDDWDEDDWDEDDWDEDDWDDEPIDVSWDYTPSDALYDAAFRYKETALWEKLSETEFFAVVLHDGTTGFVSIMGRAKAHCAIGLYLSQGSLDLIRRINSGMEESPFIDGYTGASHDCLQLILDEKEFLNISELSALQTYADSHGLTLEGEFGYPHFWRMKPYYTPWHPISELEEKYLEDAAGAAIFLAEYLKKHKKTTIGLKEQGSAPGAIPTIVRTEDGYEFGEKTDMPAVSMEEYPSPSEWDNALMLKLRRMKRRETLQCRLIRHSVPVQNNPEEAPYYPAVLFCVDPQTGYALPPILAEEKEDTPENIINEFLQTLIRNKYRPSKILVSDSRTFALLEPALKTANIELEKVEEEEMDELDQVLDDFLEFSVGNEKNVYEEMIAIAIAVLEAPDSKIKTMPKELRDMFEQMLKVSVFPEDLAEKLKKKLKL